MSKLREILQKHGMYVFFYPTGEVTYSRFYAIYYVVCMKSMIYKVIKSFYHSRIVLYSIGGAVAAILDIIFLYVFTEYMGFYYLISQVISFTLCLFIGFFFQKHITFKKKGGSLKKQSSLFFLFQLIGIGINIAIMRFLVEYEQVYYIYASVIAKGIVFFWNFLMNNKYNFK